LNLNRTESNHNCPESKKDQPLKDSGQSFLNVLVLGIGNILLSDEGVGVKAVEELQNRYDCSDAVEIVDGGTSGYELLSFFEDRSHVLIIDAVNTGNEPGTIVRIEDPPAFFQNKVSPHQIGLADVLVIAAITENLPRYVTLFGIEPKQLSTGLDLSDEVAGKLSQLVDTVADELKNIGVDVQPRNR
jgi:hydrogenase maturation protease